MRITSYRAWSSVCAASRRRAAELPRACQPNVLDGERSQICKRSEFGSVLGRELRGLPTPNFEDADHFAMSEQGNGERRLDALSAREIKEITADDFAPDIVLDRAGLTSRENAPSNALTRTHAQRSCLGGKIADAPLHDEPLVLFQHDAADVGAEADLGFVRNLGEDPVEIAAFENPVGDPLKHPNCFKLVRVAIPTVAGPQRQMQDLAQTSHQLRRELQRFPHIHDDGYSGAANRRDDDRAKSRRRVVGSETICDRCDCRFESILAVQTVPLAPHSGRANDDPGVDGAQRIAKENSGF